MGATTGGQGSQRLHMRVGEYMCDEQVRPPPLSRGEQLTK